MGQLLHKKNINNKEDKQTLEYCMRNDKIFYIIYYQNIFAKHRKHMIGFSNCYGWRFFGNQFKNQNQVIYQDSKCKKIEMIVQLDIMKQEIGITKRNIRCRGLEILYYELRGRKFVIETKTIRWEIYGKRNFIINNQRRDYQFFRRISFFSKTFTFLILIITKLQSYLYCAKMRYVRGDNHR